MIKQYNPEMPPPDTAGDGVKRQLARSDIAEFLASGEDSAEVEPPAGITTECFYSNLYAAAGEHYYGRCVVRRRKSRIFLIRTDKKGGPADA